jgi:cyclase
MERIAPNVYAEDEFGVPSNFHGANYGYVVTDDGVVVIDTPMFPTDAVAFRNRLATEGDVRYLVNTDFHRDHITGNHFVGGEVVGHDLTKRMAEAPPTKTLRRIVEHLVGDDLSTDLDTKELMRLRLEVVDPDGASLIDEDYVFRTPTITFSDTLTFEVGDTTFELLHLPGHTEGHIGVYLPDQKVFFAGDNVTPGYYPSMIEALPLEWIDSLETIESMDVDTVVPGHGEIGGLDDVREFRASLEAYVDEMNALIADGATEAEAVAAFEFSDLDAMHPDDPEFYRMNVSRLYEKLFYG